MSATTTRTLEHPRILTNTDRQVRLTLRVIPYVTWTALALGVSMIAIWPFFRDYKQLPMFGVTLLLICLSAALYPILHRRGYTRLGTWLLVGVILLVVGVSPILVPETIIATGMDFVVILLLSSTIVGIRDARVVILLSVLAYTTDLVLIHTVAADLFPPLAQPIGPLLSGSIAVVVMVTGAVIIQLLLSGQDRMFGQLEAANQEIEHRAQDSETQRQYLQDAVQQYLAHMADIARGNLAARVSLAGSGADDTDPLSLLGHNLNETTARLQEMTRHIHETSGRLTQASADILAATAQQASGATEQSTAIAQTSTTIDEVRAIAQQMAQRAQEVTELAQHTMVVSQDGQQAISASIAGMERVKLKVETIAQNILALSEQAQTIGQIIGAVADIAAQSNMLALNAAVEAARAGESGKGFAVVASEVRALAEQSQAATVQVKDLLTEIQQGVNTAVMVTEDGMKGTDAGMRLVAGARETIRQLADSVEASAQASQQIAAAAAQQLTGMEQIAQAMESILRATTQAMSGTQQSEKAAVALNDLSGQLHQAVAQYRL